MDLKKVLFGKVSNKIYFSFAIFILLLIFISLFFLFQLNKIGEPINKQIPENLEEIKKDSNLDSLARFIQYYDEVLTMSARNYAFTQDKKWETRYRDVEPKLDAVIKEAIEKGDEKDKEFFSSVDSANMALVKMEYDSIDYVNNGQVEKAIRILESDEYWEQKEIYLQGLVSYVEGRGYQYNGFLETSTKTLDSLIESTQEIINFSQLLILIILIFSLILLIFSALFLKRNIAKPISDLILAAEQLQKKNFKVRVDIKTGDELQELGGTFNETAEALERMDEEHKQLEKAKTEFLSITSHELRSPMTPMKAQLQMLEEEYFGKLNEKQKESLDIVLRNTERLDRIILDFLEISRIEAARLKFRFVKTNLVKHIDRLVKEMQGFMPEKKIKIVTDINELPVVKIDPDRVMQVLRNLINNTKKFSKEGSMIKISVKVDNGMFLFSVADQGIGIKQKDLKKIFEPFFQAEQTMYRKHRGTGLGLAIARGIVESQNGKIWVKSEIGKGSIFYFTFPLKPVKKIKPIKLLFSDSKNIENKLRRIFPIFLGPLGVEEFETFSRKNKLNKKELIDYIDHLEKKGILTSEKGKLFKERILFVFGDKPKIIGAQEFAKKGFIKKEETIAEKLKKRGLVK